jgi:hypothetical protein
MMSMMIVMMMSSTSSSATETLAIARDVRRHRRLGRVASDDVGVGLHVSS